MRVDWKSRLNKAAGITDPNVPAPPREAERERGGLRRFSREGKIALRKWLVANPRASSEEFVENFLNKWPGASKQRLREAYEEISAEPYMTIAQQKEPSPTGAALKTLLGVAVAPGAQAVLPTRTVEGLSPEFLTGLEASEEAGAAGGRTLPIVGPSLEKHVLGPPPEDVRSLETTARLLGLPAELASGAALERQAVKWGARGVGALAQTERGRKVASGLLAAEEAARTSRAGRAVGRAGAAVRRAAETPAGRAATWVPRHGAEVLRPRGLGISAAMAIEAERVGPEVAEFFQAHNPADEIFEFLGQSPEEHPWAYQFTRDLLPALVTLPMGIVSFKAHAIAAAAKGDVAGLREMAEVITGPVIGKWLSAEQRAERGEFDPVSLPTGGIAREAPTSGRWMSPVELWREDPANSAVMVGLLAGMYGLRIRAHFRGQRELAIVERMIQAGADIPEGTPLVERIQVLERTYNETARAAGEFTRGAAEAVGREVEPGRQEAARLAAEAAAPPPPPTTGARPADLRPIGQIIREGRPGYQPPETPLEREVYPPTAGGGRPPRMPQRPRWPYSKRGARPPQELLDAFRERHGRWPTAPEVEQMRKMDLADREARSAERRAEREARAPEEVVPEEAAPGEARPPRAPGLRTVSERQAEQVRRRYRPPEEGEEGRPRVRPPTPPAAPPAGAEAEVPTEGRYRRMPRREEPTGPPRVVIPRSEIQPSRNWRGEPVPEEGWRREGDPGRIYPEPLELENVPETLYHVTSHGPEIRESGVLRAQGTMEAGGLGGGAWETVSFTSSRDTAILIARELERMGVIANERRPFPDVLREWAEQDARISGADPERMQVAAREALRNYEVNANWVRENEGPDASLADTASSAYNFYLMMRQSEGGPENPVIFGRAAAFRPIRGERISIVAVPKGNIPPEAYVHGDRFLTEVAVHADVPIEGAREVQWRAREPGRGFIPGTPEAAEYEGRAAPRDLQRPGMETLTRHEREIYERAQAREEAFRRAGERVEERPMRPPEEGEVPEAEGAAFGRKPDGVPAAYDLNYEALWRESYSLGEDMRIVDVVDFLPLPRGLMQELAGSDALRSYARGARGILEDLKPLLARRGFVREGDVEFGGVVATEGVMGLHVPWRGKGQPPRVDAIYLNPMDVWSKLGAQFPDASLAELRARFAQITVADTLHEALHTISRKHDVRFAYALSEFIGENLNALSGLARRFNREVVTPLTRKGGRWEDYVNRYNETLRVREDQLIEAVGLELPEAVAPGRPPGPEGGEPRRGPGAPPPAPEERVGLEEGLPERGREPAEGVPPGRVPEHRGRGPIRPGEVRTGYRAERHPPGVRPKVDYPGGTEGMGLYVTSSRELAEFFSDVDRPVETVRYREPRNPLIVNEEPLYILQESEELFRPIRAGDSEWTRLNKQAIQDAGITEQTFNTRMRDLQNSLTNAITDAGYDAVRVTSGGESWDVLLDSRLYAGVGRGREPGEPTEGRFRRAGRGPAPLHGIEVTRPTEADARSWPDTIYQTDVRPDRMVSTPALQMIMGNRLHYFPTDRDGRATTLTDMGDRMSHNHLARTFGFFDEERAGYLRSHGVEEAEALKAGAMSVRTSHNAMEVTYHGNEPRMIGYGEELVDAAASRGMDITIQREGQRWAQFSPQETQEAKQFMRAGGPSEAFGSRNRIVSTGEADAIKSRLRRPRKYGGGPSAEELKDWTRLGLFYLEGGVEEFAEWSERMQKDLPAGLVGPHLKTIYSRAARELASIQRRRAETVQRRMRAKGWKRKGAPTEVPDTDAEDFMRLGYHFYAERGMEDQAAWTAAMQKLAPTVPEQFWTDMYQHLARGEVPPEDVGDKTARLIRQAKSLLPETGEELAQFRAQQAARAGRAIEAYRGEEAAIRSLAGLKGRAERPAFEEIRGELTQAEVDQLFERSRMPTAFHPKDVFSRVQAFNGLYKLLGGEVPSQSELIKMELIYGPELIRAVHARSPMGFWQKGWRTAVDAANFPRALLASTDLSASMRQGMLLLPAHPKPWANAFVTQLKVMFSESNMEALMESIRTHPNYELMERARLYIAPWGEAARLTLREEMFLSRFGDKFGIPLGGGRWLRPILASNRAYTGFLNKLRADVFNQYVEALGPEASIEDLQGIARFINHATGRGGLGPAEPLGPAAAGVFFSPRFLVSRFQALADVAHGPKVARQMAAKSLALWIGATLSALALADLTGVGEVDWNLDSPDSLKLRVGNTRFDPWAGYQQLVRYLVQFITGKETKAGVKIPTRGAEQTALRLVRSKMAPGPAFLWDVKTGTDFMGQDLLWDAETVGQQAFNRLMPIAVQDIVDAWQADNGVLGGIASVSSALGMGVITYRKRPGREEDQTPAEELTGVFLSRHWSDVPRTYEQKVRNKWVRKFTDLAREGKELTPKQREQWDALPPADKEKVLNRASATLQSRFKMLRLDEAFLVVSVASPDELMQIGPLLQKKLERAIKEGTLTQEEQQAYLQQYTEIGEKLAQQ